MITEYYLKIVQAGSGYNYTVKFYIGEQCYCAEGSADTKEKCLENAEIFEKQIVLESLRGTT